MMTQLMLMAILSVDTANKQPVVGVLDFAAQGGASSELSAAVSTLVANELQRLGVFKVTTSETMRVMLGVERQRQLLGCENCNTSVLSDLSTFDYIVTGKVLKTKGEVSMFLSLVAIGSSAPVSTVNAKATSESALLQDVPSNTIKLVGKVLQGKQGSLVVSSSEIGADVKIDDTQIGTTPLVASVPVPAGPHLVAIEKNGFSTVKKEVRITPDQVSEEFFRMVPSPDTIQAYESRAKMMRILAWTAAGIGVAGVGLAIAGQSIAMKRYGESSAEGTFLYYRNQLNTRGDACGCRETASKLSSSIATWQTISYVGMAAAAAGAISSFVLFVIGDPPDKYNAYKSVAPVPSVGSPPPVKAQVLPTLGGFALTGSF